MHPLTELIIILCAIALQIVSIGVYNFHNIIFSIMARTYKITVASKKAKDAAKELESNKIKVSGVCFDTKNGTASIICEYQNTTDTYTIAQIQKNNK